MVCIMLIDFAHVIEETAAATNHFHQQQQQQKQRETIYIDQKTSEYFTNLQHNLNSHGIPGCSI